MDGVVLIELAQGVFDVFQSQLLATKSGEVNSKIGEDLILYFAKEHRCMYLLDLGLALFPKYQLYPLDSSISQFRVVILRAIWQAATLHQIAGNLPCEEGTDIADAGHLMVPVS